MLAHIFEEVTQKVIKINFTTNDYYKFQEARNAQPVWLVAQFIGFLIATNYFGY